MKAMVKVWKWIMLAALVWGGWPNQVLAHTEAAPSIAEYGWLIAFGAVTILTMGAWAGYFFWRAKLNSNVNPTPSGDKGLVRQKEAKALAQKEIRAYKQRAREQKNRMLKWAAGGTLFSVLLFMVYALTSSIMEPIITKEDLRQNEEIQVETFADQGREHIPVGAAHEPYNSSPPTSGPHYATWEKYGFYKKPLVPEKLVHNLEHGDIVIYYRPDLGEEVMGHLRELSKFTYEGSGVLVVPFPEGVDWPEEVIATAWTKMLRQDKFDEAKLETFIARYIYQGPEKLAPQ